MKAEAGRADALGRYRNKRNFGITPEPEGADAASSKALAFVIQKHWASRLHYDFRLELDGVLLSWAVPKGPCYDPKEKRMAVHVEDHPVSYGSFEGTIPPKQYGAGTVIVWDNGSWEPIGDAREAMAKGKLVFRLHGQKLAGLWELVRIAKPGDKQDPWMLFKKRDEWARPLSDYDVIAALPDSVVATPLGLIEERDPRQPASIKKALAAEPDLSKAKRAKLPARLSPQLATLASTPPVGSNWTMEPKWDGYRILARIDGSGVKLFTRNHHDWTTKMQTLAEAIAALGIESTWLDGEIVVIGNAGVPDFGALQNAMDARPNSEIEYFVFDSPYLRGLDMRQVPLASRRAALRRAIERTPSDRVRFSQDFSAPAEQMLQAASAAHLEGIIAKQVDSVYADGTRTETWLKLKCVQRQEFVVVAFADRAGAAAEVGSLYLGYYDEGQLRYAGNVGTGWNSKTARELHAALSKIETKTPTVDAAAIEPGRWTKRKLGSERWVAPTLVVEVAFAEWTADNHIRHGSFKGVRADKAASEVVRELAAAHSIKGRNGSATSAAAEGKNGIKISHPERIIDPSTGITKLQLVRYYESVARWILPHLKGRPVSLVRAPEGVTGELFFQKHPDSKVSGLTVLDPALWPGHAALLAVDNADALASAAQMNVIEFHTWNSTVRRINVPDRIVFDLDPGEGVPWKSVQEAATLMRAMLDALGLRSWLKTSGGKGLHVVVPISSTTPKFDNDAIKAFSQAIVQHMAKTIPQKFVAKSGAANRVGKVFVDYLRNGHGQTTVAAYSARSRPGLGVSMPVSWEQLPALKSGAQWTVATAREHLSLHVDDPWAEYWTQRQTLSGAMKRLGFDVAALRDRKG